MADKLLSFNVPAELHPATQELVRSFATVLAGKLRRAEEKYHYGDAWQNNDWEVECRRQLRRHIVKGDPIDVAAYCAFMWHHGWSTSWVGMPRHDQPDVSRTPK